MMSVVYADKCVYMNVFNRKWKEEKVKGKMVGEGEERGRREGEEGRREKEDYRD